MSQDPGVDRLLSMVDIENVNQEVRIETQSNPAIDALNNLINAYKAVKNSSGLEKVGHVLKYGTVFITFTDKFKGDIGTDSRGQYLRMGGSTKLRPINARGHSYFYQVVSYRME